MCERIKDKKFIKKLWAGKNQEDGSIAFNYMYNSKKEAEYNFADVRDYYKIVRVELQEID